MKGSSAITLAVLVFLWLGVLTLISSNKKLGNVTVQETPLLQNLSSTVRTGSQQNEHKSEVGDLCILSEGSPFARDKKHAALIPNFYLCQQNPSLRMDMAMGIAFSKGASSSIIDIVQRNNGLARQYAIRCSWTKCNRFRFANIPLSARAFCFPDVEVRGRSTPLRAHEFETALNKNRWLKPLTWITQGEGAWNLFQTPAFSNLTLGQILVVREPIGHILSAWTYWQGSREPGNPLHVRSNDTFMTYAIRNSNFLSKHLNLNGACDTSVDPSVRVDVAKWSEFKNDELSSFSKMNFCRIAAFNCLQAASESSVKTSVSWIIKHLRSIFLLVTPVERLSEFMVLLNFALNSIPGTPRWELPLCTPAHTNKHSSKHGIDFNELSAKDRLQLRRLFRYDSLLYKEVSALFDKQIAEARKNATIAKALDEALAKRLPSCKAAPAVTKRFQLQHGSAN